MFIIIMFSSMYGIPRIFLVKLLLSIRKFDYTRIACHVCLFYYPHLVNEDAQQVCKHKQDSVQIAGRVVKPQRNKVRFHGFLETNSVVGSTTLLNKGAVDYVIP